MSLECLGLTFAEVCAVLAPRGAGQTDALRAHYKAVLFGAEASGPLRGAHPEMTRRIRSEDGADEGAEPTAEPPAARPANPPANPPDTRSAAAPGSPLAKFTLRTQAGFETESVIIPMQSRGKCWKSLCVSSQVGCAMGCTFCETAQIGLRQQLSAAEIVAQFSAAWRHFGGGIRNVVFMGMGEPLDNFENVTQAIRVLTDPHGLSLGMDRITVSTVGRVAGIRRLAGLDWRRLNLAVSLNAPTDAIRSQIMPINRVDSLAALRAALLDYPRRNCQYVMVEYVLIPGVNDAWEHAQQVVAWTRGETIEGFEPPGGRNGRAIPCCVNVIPYNPRRESPWPAPDEERVGEFVDWLLKAGQFAKRRVTKGAEFMAACGQLGNREFARKKPPLVELNARR